MIQDIPQPKIFGIPIDREIKMDNERITIKDAMDRLKQAMIEDRQYALLWHQDVASHCYDCIPIAKTNEQNRLDHKIANDSATRFMKMCFDVETSKDMLLKDEDNNELLKPTRT